MIERFLISLLKNELNVTVILLWLYFQILYSVSEKLLVFFVCLFAALSPDTSVSVFTWQVNIYGQGKPSVYLGLFDINRWYHAQMPDSLRYGYCLFSSLSLRYCYTSLISVSIPFNFSFRSGESLHNCSYFALWSLDSVVSRTSPHHILDILVHERSLNRGVSPSYPPPEQFFNPSTFNFGMYFHDTLREIMCK